MSSSCNAGQHKRGARPKKKQRTSAEQLGSEERPTKKQRTSAEQRCSETSSAEQPVVDGPSQGTFCVITHAATLIQLSEEDVKMDMVVALHNAMKENPDAIIVCLSRLGVIPEATLQAAQKTFEFIQKVCEELERMQREGKAPAIRQRHSVAGVI